jgi:hypothetical protein
MCANSIQFHQTYANERIRMCPYDVIRRGFLGIQWKRFQFQLYSGFGGSTGLPEDGPSGHSQETSGFSMYLRRAEVQLMCRVPTWEWTVFGCQTVPSGCDKYVIR